MKLESLPAYVHADCCREKHYLSVNRAIDGSWCIGYIEFYGGTAIGGLALNDCSDLNEAATRMEYALKRWKRRGKDASAQTL